MPESPPKLISSNADSSTTPSLPSVSPPSTPDNPLPSKSFLSPAPGVIRFSDCNSLSASVAAPSAISFNASPSSAAAFPFSLSPGASSIVSSRILPSSARSSSSSSSSPSSALPKSPRFARMSSTPCASSCSNPSTALAAASVPPLSPTLAASVRVRLNRCSSTVSSTVLSRFSRRALTFLSHRDMMLMLTSVLSTYHTRLLQY